MKGTKIGIFIKIIFILLMGLVFIPGLISSNDLVGIICGIILLIILIAFILGNILF